MSLREIDAQFRRCTTATPGQAGLLILLGALLLSACGADDRTANPDTNPGPTVADSQFSGHFTIADVADEGELLTLSAPYAVEFETEYGTLTVTGPCNDYLGSFSLEQNGRASITLPGATNKSCSVELSEEELLVVQLLERAANWTETTSGFRLESTSTRTSVSLAR